MPTGAEFVNIKSKRIMGADDFGTRMLDYARAVAAETNEHTYDAPMFHRNGVTLAADGKDRIQIIKTASDSIASDGIGHFMNPDSGTWDWFKEVYFQNAATVAYYVGLKYCEIPQGIQINPRTGAPEYVKMQEQVGEVDLPDAVVDNGSNITLNVNSVLEAADNTGRRVWVWMVNPAEGATSEAIAIEECVVSFSGGQNQITTSGLLGQSSVSAIASNYRVAALGPSVKRYTDLRGVSGCAFVGIVTGSGALTEPTSFNVTDQKVIPYSWVSALVDGLPQDFIPLTDGAYDMGSPTKRWANIYASNLDVAGLTSSGHLLPTVDDTYDLGSITLQWRDLWLDGKAYVHDINLSAVPGEGVTSEWRPDTTDTYDLGTFSYRWDTMYSKWVSTDRVDAVTLEVDSTAGNGVNSHFMPALDGLYEIGSATYKWARLAVYFINSDVTPNTDDTFDLGESGKAWKDLWIDGTAYVDSLSLSVAPGEGVISKMWPDVTDTHDFGAPTRRWNDAWFNAVTCDQVAVATGTGNGVTGHLEPLADALYHLGNASYQWEELFLSDGITCAELKITGKLNTLHPYTDDFFYLGATDFRWKWLYCTNINFEYGSVGSETYTTIRSLEARVTALEP